jgi:hypothetical protein
MTERPAGFGVVATISGVPVLIHWSLPIGGVLFYGFAGSGQRVELLYFSMASVLVVAIHTLGHLAAAQLLKIEVLSVYMTWVCGRCMPLQLASTIRGNLLFLSSGLLAQLVLLLGTLFFIKIFGSPIGLFGRCLVDTFTFYNGFLLFLLAAPWRVGGMSSDGLVLWQTLLWAWKR